MAWIYILSNKSHTLYTGVTNDLGARLAEHADGRGSRFVNRYHFTRLVYYEEFPLIVDAIKREKQIKGWRRSKKVALIQSVNPDWLDLAHDLSLVFTPGSRTYR